MLLRTKPSTNSERGLTAPRDHLHPARAEPQDEHGAPPTTISRMSMSRFSSNGVPAKRMGSAEEVIDGRPVETPVGPVFFHEDTGQ